MTADPTEAEPLSHPHLSVLTLGFRTPLASLPENQDAMNEAMDHTVRAFSPRNKWQVWLTDDIAVAMLRLDRVARIERRERDRAALRAESFWDDDRRLLADELGGRLDRDPAKVVPRLKSTPQGCDWLIGRWGWLMRVLDGGQAWDAAQRRLAINLLGTPREVRAAADAWLGDPARLARDEVAALERQKARVAEADALDRALAMADAADPDTPEFRRLRRYEASLHRRMRWSIAQLELMPKFAEAHPTILAERWPTLIRPQAETRPETEAEPEPDAPAPPSRPGPTPEIEAAPRTRRPDPAKLRARVRHEARRRTDRLDC